MTTAFGIRAFDPKIKEEYLLLASDSQISYKNDDGTLLEIASYDCKKLIKNNHGVILFSGTIVDIMAKNDETKKAYADLFEDKHNKKGIIKNLRQILKEFNNHYIIGSNFNNNLKLYSYCLKKYNFFNISLTIPVLNETNTGFYAGSGNNYTYDFIDPILQKNIMLTNLGFKVSVSLENLIDISVKGMKEASKKDDFTGGHMDLAIITKNDIKLTRNYVDL